MSGYGDQNERANVAGVGSFNRVVVIGGGAWGTALALVAARAGCDVAVLIRDPAVVAEINERSTNARYLPGVVFTDSIFATTDPQVVATADVVIASVPAQAMRATLQSLAGFVGTGTPIISAAKGIERGTGARMSEVIAAAVPSARPAVISGPSFASDVARGLPTALTIAAADLALAERLALALASARFRPYASQDVTGVELGGALKNVIAIAAGIVRGAGLGASAEAALAARGFAELSRLARRLGAESVTLMGLSGLGDLVLSASSAQSRNFALGVAIGEGGDIADLTATGSKLAEGAYTASVVIELGVAVDIELPIAEAVADVLAGRLAVGASVERLMTRPLRSEA